MAIWHLQISRVGHGPRDDEAGSPTANIKSWGIEKVKVRSSVHSHTAYTTRKESRGVIVLSPEGVNGDYNHYRTVALGSTPDRAVSISTSDIIQMLKNAGWNDVREGDLGENIYVDSIDYTFFRGWKVLQVSDQG